MQGYNYRKTIDYKYKILKEFGGWGFWYNLHILDFGKVKII